MQEITAEKALDRAIISLVGDLATYRPNAKVVFLEGDEVDQFDLRMISELFSEFSLKVNLISLGSRSNVERIYQLLNQAAENASLGTKFYAVVDKDADSQGQHIGIYKWDRYHIENYLLEPKYILNTLVELLPNDFDGMSESDILGKLRDCARETIDELVGHDLETAANTEIVSLIKTRTSRNGNISQELNSLLQISKTEIDNLVDGKYSQKYINTQFLKLKNRREQQLKSDDWIKEFRGRDILKRFVGRNLKSIGYEIFRNLIIARMKYDGFKPKGMKEVIENILKD